MTVSILFRFVLDCVCWFVCLFFLFFSLFKRPIRDSVFLIHVNMVDRVSKNLMVIGASAQPTMKEKTVSSPSVSLYNRLDSFGSWVPTSRCWLLTICSNIS